MWAHLRPITTCPCTCSCRQACAHWHTHLVHPLLSSATPHPDHPTTNAVLLLLAAGPAHSHAQVMVPGSLSLAWSIGRAVLEAQAAKADPVAAVLGVYQGSGRLLFCGKVVEVQRSTQEGFVRGNLCIRGTASAAGYTAPHQRLGDSTAAGEGTGQAAANSSSSSGGEDMQLRIEFQNENLVARTAAGGVLACVPDLICVLDCATGEAVATEELRYGLQVAVVALPAHPMLRTAAALEVVGPAAFGYSGVKYDPVGPWPQQMHTVHELDG